MDKIVLEINEAILAKMEGKSIITYGIADPVLIRDEDAEKTLPAIVNTNGECVDVFGEADMHDITLYHRINGVSYSINGGYGSRPSCNTVADMSIVVYGKRSLINQYKLKDELAGVIAEKYNLSSVDFNAIRVFSTEFSGLPFFLNPDYFLFKLNYSVTSTYDNRCKKR